VCIHCSENVFTDPLPSKDGGIHRQHGDFISKLIKGGYEIIFGSVYPPIVARQQLSKHLPAAMSLRLSLILRPTVSRPVCLGIKHPSVAYDQVFITVRQLRVCWCGALSLSREDGSVVCSCCWSTPAQSVSGPSPVELATIFYSQNRDFSFRRFLRLAGLRWRHSTPELTRNDIRTVGRGVFYAVRLVLNICSERKIADYFPRGGGVEYLHRSPASRRRRQKGKSRIWDSKIWSRIPQDSDPRINALARTSSNCKWQTHRLVREDVI
jgi:hypothetical protein